ncbi:MAG: aldehyde dehydrogenase family protein, partial [Albidovulum sp.]|nr:aldehyde dehydrogenase family protein [Albidovulum sp.]
MRDHLANALVPPGYALLELTYGLGVGMVWLNTQIIRHLPAPFGGAKQSGFGREGGVY